MRFKPDKLTSDQEHALVAIRKLWSDGKPGDVVVVNGYAGTGKTTLLGIVTDEFGGAELLAPTGKAALRLQEATDFTAKTIHRWLYSPIPNPTTGGIEFVRKKLENITIPSSKLVIIDEASMVPKEIWEEMVSVAIQLGLKLIVVGDEFQLPPVSKNGETFNLLVDTKAFQKVHLKEVTRQALESPIVRASMGLRRDRPDALIGMPISENLVASALEVVESGGAVVCWRNSTRFYLNKKIREAKLLPYNEVVAGEPLLILKNNYELEVFNGETESNWEWIATDPVPREIFDRYQHKKEIARYGKAKLSSGLGATLCIDEIHGRLDRFHTGGIASGARRIYAKVPHVHANFGYTLTGHKAQGSEWGSVLVVIEDGFDMSSYVGRRWTYTAITRAKEELVLHYASERLE